MMKTWLICAAALMALPTYADNSPNLVQDAGFEEEGQAQWLTYDFGPQFKADWDAVDQKHGEARSLKLSATQSTDAPNKWEMSGAKQVFPVRPGDIITGGAWLMVENLKGVEVYLECKWLDSSQKEMGSGIGTTHKTSGSSKWEYQNLEMWTPQERTAPDGASFVDLRLTLLAAGTADTATGTAWWDDVQFNVIPKK
jgi:hypothetical protein